MRRNLLVAIAALSLAGCSGPPSPVTPSPQPSGIGLGSALLLGGATAAGAGIGDAVGGGKGAVIGGVVGLAGGALADNLLTSKSAQHDAEIYAAGQRAEAVKIMDQYWQERAIREEEAKLKLAAAASSSAAPQTVSYSGGTISGINVAPRDATTAAPLQEPQR